MKNKYLISFIIALICISLLLPECTAYGGQVLTQAYKANISSKGVLTVSSSDEMNNAPWISEGKQSSIKSVKIATVLGDQSIKTIGSYAFSNCQNLTSVEIPITVTTIGKAAFSGCKNLKSVSLPPLITSIGRNAFPKGTVLKGASGSYVEQYAAENGYTFVSNDQEQSLTAYDEEAVISALDLDSLYQSLRYNKKIDVNDSLTNGLWEVSYYLLNNPIKTLTAGNKKDIIKTYLLETYISSDATANAIAKSFEEGTAITDSVSDIKNLYEIYCDNFTDTPLKEKDFYKKLYSVFKSGKFKIHQSKTGVVSNYLETTANSTAFWTNIENVFGKEFVNKYKGKNGIINSDELVQAMYLVRNKKITGATDLQKLNFFNVKKKAGNAVNVVCVIVDQANNIAQISKWVSILSNINEKNISDLKIMMNSIEDEEMKDVIAEIIDELEHVRPFTWVEVGLKVYADTIADILPKIITKSGSLVSKGLKLTPQVTKAIGSICQGIGSSVALFFTAQDVTNLITGNGKDAEALHDALRIIPLNAEHYKAAKTALEKYKTEPTESNRMELYQMLKYFYDSSIKCIELDAEYETQELFVILNQNDKKQRVLETEKAKFASIASLLKRNKLIK